MCFFYEKQKLKKLVMNIDLTMWELVGVCKIGDLYRDGTLVPFSNDDLFKYFTI